MKSRDIDEPLLELQSRLRALADEPVADGDDAFRAALHRRLVAAGPPPALGVGPRLRDALERRRHWAWPTAGVMAGAATFALLVLVRGVPTSPFPSHIPSPSPIASGDVTPVYSVPSAKVAVIKLSFTAEVQVEDVTFEVTLPEGLAFWSRGQALAERTFRWPGRLEPGDNLVPIAVRGGRPGRYHVRAKVSMAGNVLEHEVVLDVKGEAG